ncbi:demethylmenaquinone methyltransferase [Aciduricibacillus chroicocephali]|uniref:Demethylmenaquinone methyltransferase n=1 Tax=Aciduricibacillus chroicocephali TaxID=3054939 RepID=A0ABY9KRD6_9BACI|nr:demethylmenaquinone methyltransferase [Bacillaceae bacterium 44XB]
MREQSKSERVHDVFESIYGNYDFMNSVISFQRHKAWRKDVMERMNVQPGARCLDLCCGTGDWTFALAKAAGANGKVTGLDFSANMLSVAEKRKKKLPPNDIEFIQGDAMDLPFADSTFDYVTIGFGLRNVPNYDRVLHEMYRVLKPGGMAVCLETSQPTLPVFRQGYYLYFKYIMPMFGKLLVKSYEEYEWLYESAKDFPGKKELEKMFLNAGFDQVVVKSYTGGVAAAHIGFKILKPKSR